MNNILFRRFNESIGLNEFNNVYNNLLFNDNQAVLNLIRTHYDIVLTMINNN